MRLLLDEDSGAHSLVKALRADAHDVERVVDVGSLGSCASDAAVYAHAVTVDRVLVTRNGSDFIEIAKLPDSPEHPGILIIHDGVGGAALRIDAIVRGVANISRTYETTRAMMLDLNQHVW